MATDYKFCCSNCGVYIESFKRGRAPKSFDHYMAKDFLRFLAKHQLCGEQTEGFGHFIMIEDEFFLDGPFSRYQKDDMENER